MDNAEYWKGMQAIASNKTINDQRPSVGRYIQVNRPKSKKHGLEGVVLRHEVTRYDKEKWYYGGSNMAMMREVMGRYGYSIKVRTPEGNTFWVDADWVDVISPPAEDDGVHPYEGLD